jgi:hypothetical protein
MQILRRLGPTGAYLLFMIVCIPVGHAAGETSINSVKTLVEQVESGKADSASPEQFRNKVSEARKELDAHLEARQNDIEALILSARLSIIEVLATPTVISKGKELPDPKLLFISQHVNLDRALKLEPENAEVHYWKARLYGIRPPSIAKGGRLVKTPIDLDNAIRFSSKAVQLDPKNVGYREALAIHLVDSQRRKEALEVINTSVTEHNPIYILLKDMEAFPIPEGTIFSKEDSESYGDMQMSRGRITNFPQLRVQVFIVPMAASTIEAFYQRQWPKFRFLSQRPGGPYAQFMRFEPTGLRPAASISEAEKWAAETDVIALSMMELRNPTKEQREETPSGHALPPSLGEAFCYLFYVNLRRVD